MKRIVSASPARRKHRTSRGRLITALTGAFLALAAGTAGAAGTAPAHPDFTAQAVAAHLTKTQATALQAEADRYLTATGGTQVSPNTIDLNGRGKVYVAIPGEAQPRSFPSASGSPAAADPCDGGGADYHHFCAYSRTYWSGSHIDMYTCGSYNIPWTGAGSWDNNQTVGTRARMYNPSGTLIYTTPPAHSYDANGDWTHVHTVRNC